MLMITDRNIGWTFWVANENKVTLSDPNINLSDSSEFAKKISDKTNDNINNILD